MASEFVVDFRGPATNGVVRHRPPLGHLAPITGQLVAQAVLKGETPAELAPLDQLR
ncbi:hypothetical protein [Paractinoplanes rishiriensis]|nr:hypothetical protein [Actinoplanes rishiriensis]